MSCAWYRFQWVTPLHILQSQWQGSRCYLSPCYWRVMFLIGDVVFATGGVQHVPLFSSGQRVL